MSPSPHWTSDFVPVVAIVGASFLLPVGGVAISVVGGIASGLATPLTKAGSDWCTRRLIGGQELLNHDLQTALLRAFEQSMRHLEKIWERSYQRDARHNPVMGESSPEAIKTLFKEMHQDGKAILTDTRLKLVVGNAEALQLLDRQDFGTQVTFNAYLHPYLMGHSEQFVAFLKQNFAPELACRFGEVLKADTKAWRAFQRLVNDSLLDAAREMRGTQDATNTTLAEVQRQLTALDDRLAAMPDSERVTTGETGLDTMIAEARDEMIAALADQFEVAQDQTRSWFEETWAVVAAESEKSREHTTAEHELTREIINRDTALVLSQIEKIHLSLESATRAAESDSPEGLFASISGKPTGSRHSPVWFIPHRWNRNFMGRNAVLRELRHVLTTGNYVAVTQSAAIHGLGGIGKTQVAIEYSVRFLDAYQLIWWVRAEDPTTLVADYAALGRVLGLEEADAADPKTVRRALEQAGGSWLLVLDNAENLSSVRPYLPRVGSGHVLITSRYPAWQREARSLALDVLSRDEAVQFLQRRTEGLDLDLTAAAWFRPVSTAFDPVSAISVGMSCASHWRMHSCVNTYFLPMRL